MPKAKPTYTTNLPAVPITNCDVILPNSVFPAGVQPSDTYAMEISGDCIEPIASDGDLAICSSTGEIKAGGFVALFMADGSMPQVKRVVMTPNVPVGTPLNPRSNVVPVFMVESLNPRQMITYGINKLKAAHAVIGFTKLGEIVERRTAPVLVQRKCLTCRETHMMERQNFLCEPCRRRASRGVQG